MLVSDWLKLASNELSKAGIATARLDTLVLLENITDKDRGWLLAHSEFELSVVQISRLNKLVERRAKHEPLAYVLGKTEFYGREFIVDHHVLEPRPESEMMIDLLKKSDTENTTIIDVGTGSGALAITAKLEIPTANVICVDIDEDCLKVARENAKKLGVKTSFINSDLVSFLTDTAIGEEIVLLCNLPYVPDDFQINPAAMNEPRLAIFGGPDGLDLYRKLFDQINALDQKPSLIFTESMPPQHADLAEIARAGGYELVTGEDFIQVFKLSA